MKIQIYDTTLRDGEQGAGIHYTLEDKLHIIQALDELGVDYIEAGNFDSPNHTRGHQVSRDRELFERIPSLHLQHARLAVFGSTRRPGTEAAADEVLAYIAACAAGTVTIVGKSWLYQVENILKTSPEENLAMIGDTIRFLRSAGKEVIFDAEHFFDGYSDNPSYALSVVETAVGAGAAAVALCDTNGGMMPDVVGMVTSAVCRRFPGICTAIHCHNDIGMAAAATASAVLNGASQIQGSISGIGERCGNANLNTLIPLLQIKLGYQCIPEDRLKKLTACARYVNEIANRQFDENEPFVGGYAFTHKGGMHIDGVKKAPRSFEHIDPAWVGNERNFLISALSGRTAIRDKAALLRPGIDRNAPEVEALLDKVRDYESRGFQYENSEASLMLIILEAFGMRRSFYTLENYQITINESLSGGICTALVKISVDSSVEITAAEGNGPVSALDLALRKALSRFYPEIESLRLTDYKVRVLNSSEATASKVRVFVETSDGKRVWRTIGVSPDIVDASRQALADAIDYKLSGMAEAYPSV